MSTNKIIVNGNAVEGMPKQVKVTVAKKELELTLVYVGKDEKGTKFTWKPVASKEDLVCTTVKAGNRVSTEIKQGDKVIFTNLTAQSVFTIVNAVFGQPISTTNSIYTKSNPDRKESKAGAGAAKVVITAQGNW
jgi:hypothetical protein